MSWRLAVLLLLVPATAGCTLGAGETDRLAAIAAQLKDDKATLCTRTHVIYGIGNGTTWLCRTNIQNGTVRVKDDEFTVTANDPNAPPVKP